MHYETATKTGTTRQESDSSGLEMRVVAIAVEEAEDFGG